MPDIHAFEPIWPNWVIDEVIGRGSFGTVWKAHREDSYAQIAQNAAVKHISLPSEADSNDMAGYSVDSAREIYRSQLASLVKEIKAMVALKGRPHIVAYEEHKIVEKAEGVGYDLFLRMELLTSLPSHIQDNGELGQDQVIKLGIHIAKALETLQSKHFIHRDIKPANIFVDAYGDFKLGDFGTARALQAAAYASTRAGTPNYMAPEVYNDSENYDQTVDIYSLGIVLYRYLNRGYLPFASENNVNALTVLLQRTRGDALLPPSQASEGLSRVILKACAPRPENRYQTAREMRKDLEALQQNPHMVDKAACEVHITCVLEGSLHVIQSTIEVCPAGQDTLIHAPQLPGYEVVGAGSVRIGADVSGKCLRDQVTFTYRTEQTVPSQSIVPVICQSDTGAQLYRGQAVVKIGEITWVDAPLVPGYEVVGEKWIPVTREADGRNKPQTVLFRMRKAVLPKQPPPPPPPPPPSNKKWLIGLLALSAAAYIWIGQPFGKQNILSTETTAPRKETLQQTTAVKATNPPKSTRQVTLRQVIAPPATARPVTAPPATARPVTAPPVTATPVSPWDSVYRVGNTVTFGTYEQDNSRGSTEAIQWRVLAREGNSALLLSVYGLDSQLYHQQRVNITWEQSHLRSWLNNSFYYNAFNSQEQRAILTTTLYNDNNSMFGTRGGNSTRDQVFLLSLNEARRYLGSNNERFGWVTNYAKANGAYRSKDTNAGWWWLRSPGDEQARAASISSTGTVDDVGNGANVKGGLVRPAIWVDITAL